ncbi:uncharacterized protein TRIVIDRAFT_218669 [Trichoderma virens Gv29-8]|uniref:Uncharacterized protein n=1 Tax=Hypocrea virens (strain Gv29-8 / FGSC 10586) TaxID=413071 RepID=G9MG65_HYPVG|nr:uncharacterized protein TRIVIDRAFT_218669 [Trichoderma virens Gv29-8]EHK26515.1 hypothetical protein TRIVIDRAFT_218669 [Trichoderma virens Gv29-8]UKZ46696.1 hypothetical protein TrVGV298_000903 [Trichoderma virens]
MDTTSNAIFILQFVLNCFSQIQLGREFESEFEIDQLKLDIIQLRLSRWCEVSRLNNNSNGTIAREGQPTPTDGFEDPENPTRDPTLAVLLDIRATVIKAQRDARKKKTNTAAGQPLDVDTSIPVDNREMHNRFKDFLSSRTSQTTNVVNSPKWAFYKKEHFNRFIADMSYLTDALESLIPEDDKQKLLELSNDECEGISKPNLVDLKVIAKNCDPSLENVVDGAPKTRGGANYATQLYITGNAMGVNNAEAPKSPKSPKISKIIIMHVGINHTNLKNFDGIAYQDIAIHAYDTIQRSPAEMAKKNHKDTAWAWKELKPCELLMETKEFKDWLNNKSRHSILWISGYSGRRKTTSRVIEDIYEKNVGRDPKSFYVLYFYVGYGDDAATKNRENTDQDILDALIDHLVGEQRDIYISIGALDQLLPKHSNRLISRLCELIKRLKSESNPCRLAVAISSRNLSSHIIWKIFDNFSDLRVEPDNKAPDMLKCLKDIVHLYSKPTQTWRNVYKEANS